MSTFTEHTEPLVDEYDVIVVGARCAGAATAMLMARSGLHHPWPVSHEHHR
jgi:alkyl hydroperoxide reductase subunit AhpF